MTKKEAKKYDKPFWITVVRKVRVLICNNCGGEMEHLTDLDSLTIATYQCPKCKKVF